MLDRTKIEAILRRAESSTLPYSQRLCAALTAAQILGAAIHVAVKRGEELAGDYRSAKRRWSEYAGSLSVGHGQSAGMVRARRLSISSPNSDARKTIELIEQRAALHNDDLELIDQYLHSWAIVRKELSTMKAQRVNSQQTALLSMLDASHYWSDKWRGRKIETDHVGELSGGVINLFSSSYRTMVGAGAAITCRATLNQKTKRKGRISRDDGQRLWERYQESERLVDDLRTCAGIESAVWELHRLAPDGRYCREIMEAAQLFQASARGRQWGGINSDCRVWELREQRVRAALRIRRAGITSARARAARRLVDRLVASPSGAVGLALTAPETIGTIQRGEIIYSVFRWRVMLDDGQLSSEYGIGHHDSPSVECIPDSVQTYHSDSVELDDDGNRVYTEAIAELTSRLDDAERRQEYRLRERRSAAERRAMQRVRTASTARKLMTIPRVSLADSYSAGNCRPGTADFCQQLSIPESELTGRELARRWRSAGYPDNSLFVRVVERLYDVE
jgi:hypothetical protein